MAISTARIKECRRIGRTGYLYGHPRDGGYPSKIENDAYAEGWDQGQREKPGVQLQKRYQ